MLIYSYKYFYRILYICQHTLVYNALLDTNTVSALTFGIFSVLIGFLFVFCLAPSILRFLYTDNFALYQEIHEKHKRNINSFVFLCLLSPLLILIPSHWLPYIETKHFIYFIFASSLLFVFLFIVTFHISTVEEKFKLLFNGLLFGLTSFLAFLPFVILIKAIEYSATSNLVAFPIIIIIWIIYSFFNGYRIAENEFVHYYIDISLGILVLIEVLVLSSNTIKVPIAEFVGIKDSETKIYKISQTDFDELNQEITKFWQVSLICSTTDDNCMLINANYDNNCTKDCNNPVYLNAQIIFRDVTNAVICPPNYKFGRDMNERCILIEQSKIKPTSQTADGLKNNSNIVTNSYILN